MDSQSPLEKIPIEILLYVSSYLSTPDLGSLRRTCKRIETSLFNSFSAEFFSKKQFMLTEASLQALLDISTHARLSPCLRHVVIGLDMYESGLNTPRFLEASQAAQHRAGQIDQYSLVSTGRDREMLARAFRNLRSLETVGMRDYNSAERFRDDCEWTSYGATTVYRQTGVRLMDGHSSFISDERARFASRVFCNILDALGVAEARPQSIEVLLTKPRGGLRDCAFNMPEFFRPSMEPVLANIKTLLLALDLSSEHMQYAQGTADFQCPDHLLRHYLSLTPNLVRLRLNFKSAEPHRIENFLLWLGRIDPMPEVSWAPLRLLQSPDPVALSQLRRLDLGSLIASPRVLLDAILKFKPTLRELSLWKVTLRPPPDQHQRLLDERANVWIEVFSQLPDLDFALVGCLSQRLRDRSYYIKFKPRGGDSKLMSSARQYFGDEMRHFADEIAQDVVVNWPEAATNDKEDESMSDASNDSEDASDDYQEASDDDEEAETDDGE